jgi:hypothetical protein
MNYHYTYYSYEEFGRGYIGKRSCKCRPEEDVKYFGSYSDKTFQPTQKIILTQHHTVEEALTAEIRLHEFYNVACNSHFANKAKQTSEKFYTTTELSKECGKKRKQQLVEDGFYSSENQSIRGKKGAHKNKELGLGIFSQTSEQKSENGKKGAEVCRMRKVGLFSITSEERTKTAKKVNCQKWQCTVTGFITNAGNLSQYQKARGIDTSNRIRMS